MSQYGAIHMVKLYKTSGLVSQRRATPIKNAFMMLGNHSTIVSLKPLTCYTYFLSTHSLRIHHQSLVDLQLQIAPQDQRNGNLQPARKFGRTACVNGADFF